MDSRVVSAIEEYMFDLFEPGRNWPKYEFRKRSYGRWAAEEILKSIQHHADIPPMQIVEEFGGQVPNNLDELLKLAGVGRKTATLFLADEYGIDGVTVDTHVFRVSKRLGWATGKNPTEVELELQKVLPKEHWNRINFQLIYHGRAICTARKAKCEICPLEKWCEKKILEKQKKK